MLNFSTIRVANEPPIARITLANPPQNVINITMMGELAVALEELERNKDVSAIVFRGSDKAFSAGVDIVAHQPETVRQMLTKFHCVIRSLVNSKKITIAVVRGNCLGGGAEVALVCDMVFTGRSARWQFPEIKLGCFPPVAATALSAVVGGKRAAALILTARPITGDEAVEIGLANASAADEDLESVAGEATERLSQLSPAALAVTKKALSAWADIDFEAGLARGEQIYFDELMSTRDAHEGIAAWLEGRKPAWKGK